MEYGLLGSVAVEREGRVLSLGGPKQRAVLAILLLRRGGTVPSDVLIDELWGESAPATARNALQGYVFQLRKVLEPDVERGQPHRILVSDGAGYRLELGPGELDIDRFERLTSEGRKLAQTSPAAAAARFDEALALWRGPPLADLAFERFAQAEVHRLDELRLAAQEDRLDALLAAGRHGEIVGEVEALVESNPHRERLRGQLLLALYRSGRQSDALAAYARAREELVEQLGIEPGSDLRELHLAILNQDPALAPPPTREPVGFRPPPRPPTRLIGRRREVDEVTALLREHHVVTLLGPGGAGKTRLALAVAEAARGDYPDGVAWVELETVRDPGLVLSEIAAAGSVGDLAAELDGRRVLLVLDNLEQVLDCAAALAGLVQQAPDIRLLVTSREPLDIGAERRYQVPLLDPVDAVELFQDRADAVGASLAGGDDTVADICRRLDGLPLALELAAAQTNVFTPRELLSRLDSPDVLAGTRRDLPDRHRTLAATIEWSHSLLDASEQAAFARLGIFAGGWTLAAAEAVALTGHRLLDSLVEKSLVRRDGERFSMLDAIRRDARRRLGADDAEALGRAHASWVAQLVGSLDGERPEGWLLELDREHPNLRAALDWAVSAGEADLALELAGAARTFWETRGHFEEGARRLDAALALPGASAAARVQGLYAAGIMQARALRFGEAARLHGQAVAVCRESGDQQGLARALNGLGIALYHLERLREAETALAESLQLKRRLGDERGAAFALLSLGNTAVAAGDLELAERHQRDALVALRAAGDELTVAGALDDLAVLRLLADDCDGAVALLEESIAVSRRLGALAHAACALAHLGLALTPSSRERARAVLAEALTLFQSLSETEGVAGALEGYAAWWLQLDAPRAAMLFGAADAIRVRARVQAEAVERHARANAERTGAVSLGALGWDAAVARGRGLALDEAMAMALDAPVAETARN